MVYPSDQGEQVVRRSWPCVKVVPVAPRCSRGSPALDRRATQCHDRQRSDRSSRTAPVPSTTRRPVAKWRAAVTLPDGTPPLRAAPGPKPMPALKRDELLVTVAAGEPVERGTGPTVAMQLEWWRDYALPAREAGARDGRTIPMGARPADQRPGPGTPSFADARTRRTVPRPTGRGGLQRQQCANRPHDACDRSSRRPNDAAMWTVTPPPCPIYPRTRSARPSATPAARTKYSVYSPRPAGDRLAAYWTLAATTGARRGELLGLAWDDVDLDAGTATIRQALRRGAKGGQEIGPTKTAASVRTVRLGARAPRRAQGPSGRPEAGEDGGDDVDGHGPGVHHHRRHPPGPEHDPAPLERLV